MNRTIALTLLLAACTAEPVVWEETEAGAPWMLVKPGGYVPPQLPGICHDSFVWSPGKGVVYAAWWSVRPDSTATLMVAQESRDGWSTPEPADTMDAGRTGCRRPAPSIAVSNGSVYLAYGMTAREGPGVFTVHWMQGMTHAPVAVVYGERFGRTAIAVSGDTVVVAYEDPNTDPRRLGLAVSTTGSHLFQYRTLVSPPTGAASEPQLALDSAGIMVVWNQTSRGQLQGMSRRGRFR